jgi:hypothetical protein
MKRFVLAAVLVFPVLTLAYWVNLGLNSTHKMRADSAKKTVQNRLDQFGPQARARLKPYFDAAQVPYPPVRLTLVGLKDERILEVYAAGANQSFRFIRSYPILAASGGPGPKLREGDQQVPEGIYAIESLNPNSSYHLSLRISYPNAFDREQAAQEGRTNLGGDIMIHGGASSVGCLAMGDEAAEDLFVLAADTGLTNMTVILSPVDFRKRKSVPGSGAVPAWTASLYQIIQSNLNELPAKN